MKLLMKPSSVPKYEYDNEKETKLTLNEFDSVDGSVSGRIAFTRSNKWNNVGVYTFMQVWAMDAYTWWYLCCFEGSKPDVHFECGGSSRIGTGREDDGLDFPNIYLPPSLIELFEPVYFKSVIRPMLAVGHEGELIIWLKNIGLLEHSVRCNKEINNITCRGVMNWVPAKIMDQYQWKCKNCRNKRNIRENSVFQDVRCHFKDILRLLAGWSKGTDVQILTKVLCIRKQTVNSVFNVAASVADKYIKSHLSRWKLGGPEVVVLIDVYPEGFEEFHVDENHSFPILCIAEIKEIPTRYWLQILDRSNPNVDEQVYNNNIAALQIIQEVVLPGSVLVTTYGTKICSYNALQSLKHLYPIIITKSGLKRHDHLNKLLDNLETIWEPALNICEKVQYLSHAHTQNHITNFLWRQKFETESFENLLHQMCYNFK
ncbi:hypothetical protein FQA39_LY00996 [Lamprigera yunnana]|nr:hypothetical protein FQA39_LY00996 [Lamprigera yunnana]